MNRDQLKTGNMGYDETRGKMVSELEDVVAGTGEILKNAANASVETLTTAREKLRGKIDEAKGQLAQAKTAVKDRAAYAADATGEYVKANPWKSVGMVAVVGVVLGLLFNRRQVSRLE